MQLTARTNAIAIRSKNAVQCLGVRSVDVCGRRWVASIGKTQGRTAYLLSHARTIFGRENRYLACWHFSLIHAIPGRLVLLGSGWAGLKVLNKINTKDYDVIMISPRVRTGLDLHIEECRGIAYAFLCHIESLRLHAATSEYIWYIPPLVRTYHRWISLDFFFFSVGTLEFRAITEVRSEQITRILCSIAQTFLWSC